MSVTPSTPTENKPPFWTQPATILDIAKYCLPLIVAVAMWASSVEVRQAKTDAHFETITQKYDSRFEQITQAINTQNETLKSVQDTLKSLNETKDERGQRLARIEAKLDVYMSQQKGSK